MNCLIVDDDSVICDLLEYYCSKIPLISNTTMVNSGFEAVSLIQTGGFDLILLDFNLPDLTGKDILKIIPETTLVIMVTSNSSFGAESYNFNQVIDFLVKPIEFTRFFKAIEKVNQGNTSQDPNELFVKEGNKLVRIDLKELLFVKSESNYVQLVLEDKKILTLITLKELEQKLPKNFVRVHRSYIVNVNKVTEVEKGFAYCDKQEIAISETYEKPFLELLKTLT